MIEKILHDLLDLGLKHQKKEQEKKEREKQIQQQLQFHAETAKNKLGTIDRILPNANTKILDEGKSNCIAVVTEILQSPEYGCAIGYQIGIAIIYSNSIFRWYIHGTDTSYSIHRGYDSLNTESIINQNKEFKPENLESELALHLEEYYRLCESRL